MKYAQEKEARAFKYWSVFSGLVLIWGLVKSDDSVWGIVGASLIGVYLTIFAYRKKEYGEPDD